MRVILSLSAALLGVWLLWPSDSHTQEAAASVHTALPSKPGARSAAHSDSALRSGKAAAPRTGRTDPDSATTAHQTQHNDAAARPQSNQPQPEQQELNAPTTSDNAQVTTVSTPGGDTASEDPENQPPQLNEAAYQRISSEIAQWQLSPGATVRHQIDISDLFTDPEQDLIDYRVSVDSHSLRLNLSQLLTVSGSIEPDSSPPTLLIEASDEAHRDQTWQSTRFVLPVEASLNSQDSRQLEKTHLYRIQTTRQLGGQHYDYDVLYCELFYLSQGEVYYAMGQTRLDCPDNSDLQQVGSYQRKDQQINFSLDSGQFYSWVFRHRYPSRIYSSNNFLVTSYDGDEYLTDTLSDTRQAAEARLNGDTGQYLYQGRTFDYLLLDEQQHYYWVAMGNYMYDRRFDNINYYQPADSDLNISTDQGDLSCHQFEPYFAFSSLTGPTLYQQTLMVFSGDYYGNYPPACYEFDSHQRPVSLSSDLEYSDYDIPLEGEIYTYILRPRPEYSQWLETLKINLIYHQPDPRAAP